MSLCHVKFMWQIFTDFTIEILLSEDGDENIETNGGVKFCHENFVTKKSVKILPCKKNCCCD